MHRHKVGTGNTVAIEKDADFSERLQQLIERKKKNVDNIEDLLKELEEFFHEVDEVGTLP